MKHVVEFGDGSSKVHDCHLLEQLELKRRQAFNASDSDPRAILDEAMLAYNMCTILSGSERTNLTLATCKLALILLQKIGNLAG